VRILGPYPESFIKARGIEAANSIAKAPNDANIPTVRGKLWDARSVRSTQFSLQRRPRACWQVWELITMRTSKIILMALLSTAMGTFSGAAGQLAGDSAGKLATKRTIRPQPPSTKGAAEQKPFSWTGFYVGVQLGGTIGAKR
jgi:hypothetical protein